MKLDPERAALVVIDVQEAFRKALPGFDDVAKASATLVEGAAAIGLPVLVTEQYPKGLGPSVPEVADHFPQGTEPLEKVRFSAAEAEGFELGERDQALVCGIEAHVCVAQTALDLLERGVEVQVAVDATGSRHTVDREVGLRRLERAGATLTTVEAALLELCERAGTPEFKAVQQVIL